MMDTQSMKVFRVKLGILKRANKERLSYVKEVEHEINRLDKMKGEDKDPHDLNHQEKVIQESRMMIPDCEKRVTSALEVMEKILQDITIDDADENVDEEYKLMYHEAKELVSFLKSS